MSQKEKTRTFYNNYGEKEWQRLIGSPYDHLNFLLHMDFIKEDLKEDVKIIDVGCGAGRYSIEFGKKKCQVTLFDISEEQLKLANEKMTEAGLSDTIKKSIRGSIDDMTMIEDNTYDVTICYGAPLNYLYESYEKGIEELYRITKPGGLISVSVNSRLGVFRMLMGRENFDQVAFFGKPDYWHVHEVLNTGNLPEHEQVPHPPRHMFTSKELKDLFKKVGMKDIELGSSPCVVSGMRSSAEMMSLDKAAWQTLMDIELASYKNEYLADSGEFLLLKGIQ